MSRSMKSFARVLGSRRLATALMVAWAALLVVWVIPFIFYGLPRAEIQAIIYRELFFRIVYALLVLSTLGCISVRIPAVVRKVLRAPKSGSTPSIPASRRLELTGDWDAARARSVLADSGYAHVTEGDGWAWGVRNRWSPLGSIGFHLAVVLVMFTVTLLILPGSTFSASAVVAEGESFDSSADDFSDVLTPQSRPPRIVFTVKEIEPRFHSDVLLFTRLDSILVDGVGNRHSMSLASPWVFGPTTLLAIEDFGYTLAVSNGVEESQTVPPRVYKLKVFPSSMSDSFDRDVGPIRYRFNVRVFGDYVNRAGKPGTRSFNLVRPRIEVSVSRVLSSGEAVEILPARVVRPGQKLRVGDGTIMFDDVGYYGAYRLTRNQSAPFLLCAIIALCAGSCTRLLFSRKEALIARIDGAVFVAVNDEMYRTSQSGSRALASAWEEAR